MEEDTPAPPWYKRNLAPAGWQEERARLIASHTFGESARQLLQMGINNTSPTTLPNPTQTFETIVARSHTQENSHINLLPETSCTTKSKPTEKPKIPEKRERSIDLGRDKKRNKELRDKLAETSRERFKDSNQPPLSNQMGEYVEYYDDWEETVREDEPITSVDDEAIISAEDEAMISVADDRSQEEKEECETNTQKKVWREKFKENIPSLNYIQPEVKHILEHYLDYKDIVSEQPSADEADELMIQVEILGPHFFNSVKAELQKEKISTTNVGCNSMMEKLTREYPILPHQTLSHLIIQVLSTTINNAPSRTSSAETRSFDVSASAKLQTDKMEAVIGSLESSTDELKETERMKEDAREGSSAVQLRLNYPEKESTNETNNMEEVIESSDRSVEEMEETDKMEEIIESADASSESPTADQLRQPCLEGEPTKEIELVEADNHTERVAESLQSKNDEMEDVNESSEDEDEDSFLLSDFASTNEIEVVEADNHMERVIESSESYTDQMEESDKMKDVNESSEDEDEDSFLLFDFAESKQSSPVQSVFRCSLCDLVLTTDAELKIHKTKPHRYDLSGKKFLIPNNQKTKTLPNNPLKNKEKLHPNLLCPYCADLIPYNEKAKHMTTHNICHICFGQKHKKRRLCPLIVSYKAEVSARMPSHICITCLDSRTSNCPEKCGWNKVTKRPKFCLRHAGKFKLHRDLCRKCHWKKCQKVATLQQANDIFISAGKGPSRSTMKRISKRAQVGITKRTRKHININTRMGTSRYTAKGMSTSTSVSNTGIVTKLHCKNLEEEIKQAMMVTLQNSLQN